MAKKGSYPFSFRPGAVQNRDTVRVIAQMDALTAAGEPDTRLLKWTGADGKWTHVDIAWSAIRTCVVGKPLTVFVLGVLGEFLEASAAGRVEGFIDESPNGPEGRGPMRDLRLIGETVFAAGMSRQVYKRTKAGTWARADTGMVLPLGTKEVAGINSIHGQDEDFMIAVGFGGEIWRFARGKWKMDDSPTNVILHRVHVIRSDHMFACGQGGTILHGSAGGWRVIDHKATEDDLWGMEWFKDTLYVASESSVYRLEGDSLERVDMKLGKRKTCSHLSADDGVLWSFGPKDITWTDGKKWFEATP
jgi:hypothetical protein